MLSNKSVQTMWVLLERGEPLSPAGGKLQHCILWQKKLKMEWKINIRKGISLKASFTQNFFALIHCLRRHSRLMAILTRERQRKRGRERERARERESCRCKLVPLLQRQETHPRFDICVFVEFRKSFWLVHTSSFSNSSISEGLSIELPKQMGLYQLLGGRSFLLVRLGWSG